jgi:hypothetical protein
MPILAGSRGEYPLDDRQTRQKLGLVVSIATEQVLTTHP